MVDLCGRHSQVGSLAGAAHLLNDNACVLTQWEQKSRRGWRVGEWAGGCWTWCWVQLPSVWGWTAPVSLVVTTVTVAMETHCQDKEGSAYAYLLRASHFESLYRLPSHVMYISQSLYWYCLHHILTCSAGMFVVHISSLTMHTIHMRCGSWASIACNQSPAQGLWVVITDGITYSPESTQLQW